MELVLIRHGRPTTIEATADGRPADPPLSDEGLDQAARLARWLKDEQFDAIYSSPMQRARMTAAPVSQLRGHEIVLDSALAEFDHANQQYIPNEELRETNNALYRERMAAGWYGDRDPEEFRGLVAGAIEEIIARHRGQKVLVVCHGGVINAWGSKVLALPNVFFFQPTYTSLNRFVAASSGERTIVSLNEAAHLR